MNCKLMALEVFAIFTSYLVFSIAFVSATNVKIYYNGIYQSPSVNYNPQSFISKDISIDPVSLNVRINIKNASSVQLGKIYVYKCRGLSPGLCVSGIQPEIAEGSFDSTYSWAALSDRTSGYPQNANILVFASVDGSVPFWTGFFYRIERTSSGNFVPYEYNADEIEVHAKDLSDVSLIRSFISSSKSIPINPNWVAKIVFPVAEGLYIIKTTFSGIQSYQFSASEISQNQISGMDTDYGFVFANSSGSIFNPVTIYLNPDYICGNSNCETEKGETQANCCLDCSCQAGYYCDTTAGCKQISGITLSLYGTQQTKVSNCYQQHTINITVRINNPPTGMSVTSTVYKLGTNPFIQTQCSGGQQTGYIFSCPVIVPAVPNCNEGTYRVGPNFINFSITYPDGKSQKTKVLSVQFPDITIGSFSCGNLLCEESLGETQSNCCYDCGCPSGYCNADQINPIKGSCETDPTNANLNVVGLFPSNFYTHRSGDSVSFLAQISNAPVTISKFYPSCSISCSRNDGQPCSSSCSVSCSKSESSDN
ncbi:MAG: hypothetical protein QXN71_00855, partial [Candidatus Aenigmatarchaeota archaeon]